MYYLCEKYYKPITVQYYIADSVSWVCRLNLADLRTNWTYERALRTELVHTQNRTRSRVGDLLYLKLCQQDRLYYKYTVLEIYKDGRMKGCGAHLPPGTHPKNLHGKQFSRKTRYWQKDSCTTKAEESRTGNQNGRKAIRSGPGPL